MRIGIQRGEDNRRLTRRQNDGHVAGVERDETLAGMSPRPAYRPADVDLPRMPSVDVSGDLAGEEPGRPLASFGEVAHGDLDEVRDLAERVDERPAVSPRREIARRTGRRVAHVAGDFGRGLAAGLVGTAVMTLGQRLEMKRSGRPPSKAPAEAVEKVFGVRPPDDRAEQRLAQIAHFAYGTGWGGLRGLLASAGLGRLSAPLVHFVAISAAAAAMLPALGLAPPPTRWSRKQVLTDALHHGVYAAATGIVFSLLHRR